MPDSFEQPSILIVDDERFNLTTLHGVLKDDYKIMVAGSGEQALKAVQKRHPDLILLDINMPGLNGYEVCRRLKEDSATQSIPVVFITALSDSKDESYGLDLGASDYITKPFNISVVRARVRTQIRLKQQSDQLSEIAFKDAITGVNNRRAFDERMVLEWNRCKREAQALSVIMLDVDQFKRYNDTYGHGKGDDCLRTVGKVLSAQMQRAADFAARYGGEEFVVLLPGTDVAGASAVAEQIRAGLEAQAVPHEASSVSTVVTASLGVASVKPSDDSTPAALLERADQSLYRAKSGGRNRVVAA